MIRRLYLFDDHTARSWAPFALTRPVGEILFGALLLRERIERALGLAAAAYVATPGLEGFEEMGAPPVLAPADAPDAEARILISTRYVPPLSGGGGVAPALSLPAELPEKGLRLSVDGETVGWVLPPAVPPPSGEALLDPGSSDRLPELGVDGRLLPSPWELVSANAERLVEDLDLLFPGGEGPEARPLPGVPGLHRIGRAPVSAADEVRVDPGVVLDTRDGAIHLGRGVHLHAFTHLRGPAYIGAGSSLLGGAVEHLSCGPVCKLRGEVSASVILGYANKAHDGYLGHAVLGRWVNLGAFTTNSDLKNNYGSVRVPTAPGAERDTGLLKVGVFLGDHVKTGIGTLLNSGTVVGAGSNLFGGAMPPKWVPPFSWGSGSELSPYRLEAFLDTAEKAMRRRDVPLSPGLRTFLARAWERGRGTEGGGEG